VITALVKSSGRSTVARWITAPETVEIIQSARSVSGTPIADRCCYALEVSHEARRRHDSDTMALLKNAQNIDRFANEAELERSRNRPE
jgi:hypothetical protein